MKILFYSTKNFERPYLEMENNKHCDIVFIEEALSLRTIEKSKGFDAISIFTGDDACDEVLEGLVNNGIKHIAVRAAGYDNVDLKKAKELNMNVANVPEYSPYAIAEHAIAIILALNRKLIISNQQVHQQNFTVDNLIGFDLNGKTIGIIGTGKIGSIFAKIMHGFGCKILACDLYENDKLIKNYGVDYVGLMTLCRESDIISIHTCLTSETKHLINRKLIEVMKKEVMIINTSRGGCVNTKDVIDGLNENRIGYYGADVYENESGIFCHNFSNKEFHDDMLKKLLSMPNVLITPHQAFATQEALANIAATTFYNINCWQNNQKSKNELTKPVSLTTTTHNF